MYGIKIEFDLQNRTAKVFNKNTNRAHTLKEVISIGIVEDSELIEITFENKKKYYNNKFEVVDVVDRNIYI